MAVMIPQQVGETVAYQNLETHQFLENRIVYLNGEVNGNVAAEIISELSILNRLDSTQPIKLLINSPGGECDAGLAIYDCMQGIEAPVWTEGYGNVASMASVILCAGEPGHRVVYPNTHVLIHQPLGGCQGQASDMEIAIKNITNTKETLYMILARHTGRAYLEIERACDRDNRMSATEAREFGLIDEIKTVWD